MHYDWLNVYQDYDFDLPIIDGVLVVSFDTRTGETVQRRQPTFKHEGSHSTSISIRISDNRLTVEGNPSRFNRPDNLFGFTRIDHCMSVYNQILKTMSLPIFTKCTSINRHQGEDGSRVVTSSNGAIITRIDLTTNLSTGHGNEQNYIRANSTQPFKNMVPRLLPNGMTVDWLSSVNYGMNKSSQLQYPSKYHKAHDLKTKAEKQCIKEFGEDTPHHIYLKRVIRYCEQNGIVRAEQKVKAALLRRKNLNYYGMIKESELKKIHQEFLDLDIKLNGIPHMNNLETIEQTLLRKGICTSEYSANRTASFVDKWKNGVQFDFKKSTVKTHRARLRRIGIDIALPCDIRNFHPIRVVANEEIEVKQITRAPSWYKKPNHLKEVA